MIKVFLASAAVLAALSAAALAAPGTLKTGTGAVLTGDTGMTLYTFKNDQPGVSNCYDACAMNWPPFLAPEGTKVEAPFSLIERKDDTYQWAKGGMPLYYFAKDKKPGDMTGDGFKNVWTVARP